MERSQFWILICIGVATGICLEVMKSPKPEHVRLAGFTKFENLLDEGGQVYGAEEEKIERAAAVKTVEAEPTEQLVAQAEVPTAAATPAPAAAAAVKKDDKKKDDKKKKKDEKKKKKKKKKKGSGLEPGADPQSDEDESEPDDTAIAKNDAPPSAGFQLAPVAPVDGLPHSVLEWEAFLMRDIDFERVSKFIKYYQTGVVKADVFYPVVQAMLEDSRPKMREFGVMALGATPSSQSFSALVAVSESDSSAKVRSQADLYMKMYMRIENLPHLTSIISSAADSRAQYEAIRLAKASAATYLKAKGPTEQGEEQHVDPAMVRYYSSILGALEQASKRSTDADVRAAAAEAAADLHTLIATSGADGQPSDQQPTT